jgi:hypothetical protein
MLKACFGLNEKRCALVDLHREHTILIQWKRGASGESILSLYFSSSLILLAACKIRFCLNFPLRGTKWTLNVARLGAILAPTHPSTRRILLGWRWRHARTDITHSSVECQRQQIRSAANERRRSFRLIHTLFVKKYLISGNQSYIFTLSTRHAIFRETGGDLLARPPSIEPHRRGRGETRLLFGISPRHDDAALGGGVVSPKEKPKRGNEQIACECVRLCHTHFSHRVRWKLQARLISLPTRIYTTPPKWAL